MTNEAKKSSRCRSVVAVVAILAACGALASGQGEGVPSPAPLDDGPPRPGLVLVDDMWVPPGAFGGESAILGVPWTSGNVNIAFADGSLPGFGVVTAAQQDAMRKAWAEIEAVSGVDFFEVPVTFGGNFILVRPNSQAGVSNSEVGMIGGAQQLRVGSNHWDAAAKYVLVHELMHALGYKHEHQRPDRDTYVTINWVNISPTGCGGNSCIGNFTLASGATTVGAYDFSSIMHYNDTSFGIGGSVVISANAPYQGFQSVMGNRSYFSIGDTNGLQALYGQPSAPVVNTVVPNAIEATTAFDLTIEVNGSNFFEGSFDEGIGVQGTQVRFNGVSVATTFVNENQVTAVIPGSMLQTQGPRLVDVVQDSEAGGASSTSATFTVLPPPCQTTLDRVGQTVAGLGDVNGDGKDDYAVGSPGYGSNAGRVVCYSGATAAPLWTSIGTATDDLTGFALAALGDVNADGKKDVIVGIPGFGTEQGGWVVRSGANGAALISWGYGTAFWDGGWAVAGVGDVENDGDQDFAVGIPGWNGDVGRVEVWSGSGSLIRTHDGQAAGDRFGAAVGGGYDLNLDGITDYVIGAPEADPTGTSSGKISIYDGATGALLSTRNGDGQYDRFGYAVAVVPTTGTAGPYGQILVGAPEIPNIFGGSGNGPGYARLFSHAGSPFSYLVLATWTGAQVGERYGLSVASAGDVNDDGRNDLLIGFPQSTFLTTPVGPGGFDLRSGATWDVLYHYQGSSSDAQLGYAVAPAGDVDGDGRLDVIVGAPGSDVGCVDAGAFYVVKPPIPPEHRKVMITEVSTGNPDCVEITNFGTAAVNLVGWKVRWKDGVTSDSPSLGTTLAPGEILVIYEFGGVLPEVPAGIQAFPFLPLVGTTVGDVAVALVDNRNAVVDEVRLEGSAGTYGEGSLGGKFRGVVHHQLSSDGVHAERIWGLDSNAGRDWTTGGTRTMGLQNGSAGLRGSDPVPMRYVRINEIDDSPDLIELWRPQAQFLSAVVNLQGWYLLSSGIQNGALDAITPFAAPLTIGSNQYVVLGESATPPPEMPAGVTYVNLGSLLGGPISWTTNELACALYDSYGRLVDLVRATGDDDLVLHNHPRAPALWSDFTGAAVRGTAGDAALGRNASGMDTNTGSDFQVRPNRSMGVANIIGTGWLPDPDPNVDVVLNANQGGGLTMIINGGVDRAGLRWSFAPSAGHLQGTGPLLGLGLDAASNWLALSVTPPFFGHLDARGHARLDIPGGTLAAGTAADVIVILQNGISNMAPITLVSAILEFDA